MSEQQVVDKPGQQEGFFNEPAEGVDQNEDAEQQQADTQAADVAEEPIDSEDEAQEIEASESEQAELGASEQEDSEGEIPGKENPDSYKYFQSQNDKFKSKLGVKNPEEISDEEAELFRTFRSNQDALNEVVEYFSGERVQNGKQSDSAEQESEAKLEPPKKPEKPADFNPYDLNDPESDSFKYQRKYEQYLEERAEFAEKKAEMVEKTIMADKQQRQQTQQEIARKQTLKQEAMAQRGYTEEQAENFVQFVDRAQNGTFQPDEVFALYEGFSGRQADAKPSQDKVEQRKREIEQNKELQKKHGAPSPGAVSGAGNPGGKEPNKDNDFFQEV